MRSHSLPAPIARAQSNTDGKQDPSFSHPGFDQLSLIPCLWFEHAPSFRDGFTEMRDESPASLAVQTILLASQPATIESFVTKPINNNECTNESPSSASMNLIQSFTAVALSKLSLHISSVYVLRTSVTPRVAIHFLKFRHSGDRVVPKCSVVSSYRQSCRFKSFIHHRQFARTLSLLSRSVVPENCFKSRSASIRRGACRRES